MDSRPVSSVAVQGTVDYLLERLRAATVDAAQARGNLALAQAQLREAEQRLETIGAAAHGMRPAAASAQRAQRRHTRSGTGSDNGASQRPVNGSTLAECS